MCGRMAIVVRETAIAERLKAFIDLNVLIVPPSGECPEPNSSYNVAPSAPIPVITEVDDHVEINTYRWGLIPHWAKDDSMANKCFNARSETMAEKPTFRTAFKRSRCIIPISGYFEWMKGVGGKKQPMYISTGNDELLYLAGLCEPSTQSATVVTTEAQGALREIHNRQPVYLDESEIMDWLNPKAGTGDLIALTQVQPFTLKAHPVSTEVNSVRNNSEELIKPIK